MNLLPFLTCFCSAGDVVKMDKQPKSVSVAAGKLSLAVCIEQVINYFLSFPLKTHFSEVRL